MPILNPTYADAPHAALAKNSEQNLLQDLIQRVKLLEAERALHDQVVEALHEFERRYQSLVENIPDVVYSLDQNGMVLTVNKAVTSYGFTQREIIGTPFVNLIYHKDRNRVVNAYFEVVARQKDYARTQQFRIQTKSGEIRWFEANCAIRFNSKGKFILQEGVCRDITENVHSQLSLIKAQEDLEEQVRKRTLELLKTNQDLQKEIIERRAGEKALKEREADLEMEKANLQEANTALKVLLKRREVDKHDLEEQVMYNVKKLVLPYLQKIQKDNPDERQKTYLKIAESNLRDVTCGFSRRLSVEFYDLSPSELKVANFIRQGKKE